MLISITKREVCCVRQRVYNRAGLSLIFKAWLEIASTSDRNIISAFYDTPHPVSQQTNGKIWSNNAHVQINNNENLKAVLG